MKEVYDYWQDQPGCCCCNVCAASTAKRSEANRHVKGVTCTPCTRTPHHAIDAARCGPCRRSKLDRQSAQKGASAHSQRSNTRVRDLPGIIEARRKRVAQRSDRVALLGPRTLQRVPTTTSRALRVSPSNPHHPERHMRAYGPASHNHQPKSELSSTKRPREHRLTQLSRCALPSRQAARANPRAEALQAVRQNQPRATSSRSRALGQASGPTKPTARNVQPKPETRPSKRADRTNRLQPPAEAGS